MSTALATISPELGQLERSFEPYLPSFADVLKPTGLPAERIVRTVVIACERNHDLMRCDRTSIIHSAMTAAVLGLEVDGVTGQGFLIPFKQRAQFIIGYRGYPTIAARSAMSINAGVVREGDDFDFNLGTEGYVRHKPALRGRGGRKITAAWATGTARGRPPIFRVMPYDDVLAIMQRSPGARRSESPWNDRDGPGHEGMVAKTAIRSLGRTVPIVAFQRAVSLEDIQERGDAAWLRPDGGMVIEPGGTTYPERQAPPAGEIAPPPRPRWVLADSTTKEWANVDLMLGWLLPRIEKASAEDARGTRERNGPIMAELSAHYPEQMERLSAALAARIGDQPAT